MVAGSVIYAIGRLDRAIQQQLNEALQPLGVSLPQFTILANLHNKGGLPNATLAARSFVSPQASNQMVNSMLVQGWVSKEQDAHNKRLMLIALTDAGRETYAQCLQVVMPVEARLLRDLPEENVAMLAATLRRLLHNLRE